MRRTSKILTELVLWAAIKFKLISTPGIESNESINYNVVAILEFLFVFVNRCVKG